MPGESVVQSERIKAKARELGFELVGIAPVRASDHGEFYRQWIAEGRHGAMEYLARDDAVARRLDPRTAWPELKSAVVVGLYYDGGGEGGREDAGTSGLDRPAVGVIARYARGRDYHKVMKKKLLELLRWIEGEVGRELPAARAYVDTGPVLERELARRAGLGWFGRNTMLINPRRGSYFFIGTLLLELELEPDAPFEADRCGRCSECVAACPTGALLGRDARGAPVIDATRCISYLTIESRGPIPPELRPAIGNRIFGCDICQECCPWNGPKFVRVAADRDRRSPVADAPGAQDGRTPRAGATADPDGRTPARSALDRPDTPTDLPGTESPSLVELMRMTREDWDRWTRGSALRRAGYAGFKRNVAVAIGNWLATLQGEPPAEALAALRDALRDEEPLVREHAAWALERARMDRG